MYATQDPEWRPIRLFQFPNTLAGDAAVTIIIQCIVTWMIELAIVSYDLHKGSVQPIGSLRPPAHQQLRRFFLLSCQHTTAEEGNRENLTSSYYWPHFLFSQVLRGFAFAAVALLLLWGPSVGILSAVGERRGWDYEYAKLWTPQIFKGALGGVLALLATPAMAAFWLVREGWMAQRSRGGALAAPRQSD